VTHEQAKAELERGTPAEVICATCPWDRLCVEPPKMSPADIERQVQKAEAEDRRRDPAERGMPMGTLLTTMLYAGKDRQGAMCPVFASRLRSPGGRKIADGLREQMQAWSESA
jgi:hypothetical protein